MFYVEGSHYFHYVLFQVKFDNIMIYDTYETNHINFKNAKHLIYCRYVLNYDISVMRIFISLLSIPTPINIFSGQLVCAIQHLTLVRKQCFTGFYGIIQWYYLRKRYSF